jgi:FkbH-like protein
MANQQLFKPVKKAVSSGNYKEAFSLLMADLRPGEELKFQNRAFKIFNALPIHNLGLTPIKIAILPTSTVDQLVQTLRLYLAREGFDANIYVSEFGTLEQTVLDPQSGLYAFDPDIIWLFTNYRDISFDFQPDATQQEIDSSLDQIVQRTTDLWKTIRQHSNAHILQNNIDCPIERPFGNFEGSFYGGHLNLFRQLNVALAKELPMGVSIYDLEYQSAAFGKFEWFDERYWYHSKHAFSLNAGGLVAHQAARITAGIKGGAKKCVVVDLDNTLWGGVIGDDGLDNIDVGTGTVAGEAFVDFQKYLKSLKNRGIILAVCSKNEIENAELPFKEHPGMVLKLEDFSSFIANWSDKARNLEQIAEELDIGLDSLVFVDDNPAERDLVRMLLPAVSVPELPSDPSHYRRILDQQYFVETVSYTSEDANRSALYRENTKRKQSKSKFSDLSEYLLYLNMSSEVGTFNSQNIKRIAQLINKSNQFHLTTTRYSDAEINAMMNDDDYFCRYFKLIDCHGDNGLISLVILHKQADNELAIDTWVMSCRVLARGMEDFVFNEILKLSQEMGLKKIVGTYIPTAKNKLVSGLYKRLGFKNVKTEDSISHWNLVINDQTKAIPNFITPTTSEL